MIVTKRGQIVDPSLYKWDADNKIFESDEIFLDIDIRDVDGVTIKCKSTCDIKCLSKCNIEIVDSYRYPKFNPRYYNSIIQCGHQCRISTMNQYDICCGDDCIVICEYDCNVKSGKGCKIETSRNCNIKCGIDSVITCGENCKVFHGEKSNLMCGKNCEITKNDYDSSSNHIVKEYCKIRHYNWKNKRIEREDYFSECGDAKEILTRESSAKNLIIQNSLTNTIKLIIM